MITGPIRSWDTYRHKESGKTVRVHNVELQVKTHGNWQTCVEYSPEDNSETEAKFAVPVDDFRQRFEKMLEVK